MLGMFVAAVTLATMTKDDTWRAESVPIMLFGMTVALVYNQELSLLLTAALVLVVAVVVLDEDLSSYITLMSAAVSSIFVVGAYSQPKQIDLRRNMCVNHRNVDGNRRQHAGGPAAKANVASGRAAGWLVGPWPPAF